MYEPNTLIGATRVSSHSEPSFCEGTRQYGRHLDYNLLERIRDLFSDGQWHSKREVVHIANCRWKLVDTYADALGLAESEYNNPIYFAKVDERTPLQDPTEYIHSREAYDKANRLLDAECTWEEVASEMGCSISTAQKYFGSTYQRG